MSKRTRIVAAVIGTIVLIGAVFFWWLSYLFFFDTNTRKFDPIRVALEVGVQERLAVQRDIPSTESLCKKPLVALTRTTGIRLQEASVAVPPTFETCVHPAIGYFDDCALWRFENCFGFAVHEFLLGEPAILKHLLRAMQEPCDYLRRSDVADLEVSHRWRFFHDRVARSPAPQLSDDHCAYLRKARYVMYVVTDDREIVARIEGAKGAPPIQPGWR